MKKLIFSVEDDEHISQLIKYNLEAAGYIVKLFTHGEEALKASDLEKPDMYLLDLMLPDMDGYDICRMIREAPTLKKIPVIMLTAKSEEFDKVLGLELGADDFITKPFSVRELVARVKAIFRRMEKLVACEEDILSEGNITINLERREVFKGNEKISTTFKEFELLKILMVNKGKVLSRDILLERVWGYDFFGESRTVDVHIRYLRQKIEEDDKHFKYIETVRGVGYRFISA